MPAAMRYLARIVHKDARRAAPAAAQRLICQMFIKSQELNGRHRPGFAAATSGKARNCAGSLHR